MIKNIWSLIAQVGAFRSFLWGPAAVDIAWYDGSQGTALVFGLYGLMSRKTACLISEFMKNNDKNNVNDEK